MGHGHIHQELLSSLRSLGEEGGAWSAAANPNSRLDPHFCFHHHNVLSLPSLSDCLSSQHLHKTAQKDDSEQEIVEGVNKLLGSPVTAATGKIFLHMLCGIAVEGRKRQKNISSIHAISFGLSSPCTVMVIMMEGGMMMFASRSSTACLPPRLVLLWVEVI
jgi:hypothetical protein